MSIVLLWCAGACAQEEAGDDGLNEFVATAGGRERAADSCVRVLNLTVKMIATHGRDLVVTNDDAGWLPVSCARWLGDLEHPNALRALEAVVALRREAPEESSAGRFLRQLQQNAFRARVAVLLRGGARKKIFRELIAAYEHRASGAALMAHDLDLTEFSEEALAERDEFIDDLLRYGRDRLLPVPTLPAATESAFRGWRAFDRFLHLVTVNSPAKRRAVIGLLIERNPGARELAAHLIDLSPETVDTLIALHAAAAGNARAAYRTALETLRENYALIISDNERELAGEKTDSPRWMYVKSELDVAKTLLARVESAVR